MRLLLILSLLSIVSCGKSNEVSKKGFVSAYSSRSMLTIHHDEGKSKLRNQLMNILVEESLENKSSDDVVPFRLELENYPMNKAEELPYAEKETHMSKIVVSYPSRVEIYFAPEKSQLKDLLIELNLSEELDRKFKWVLSNELTRTERNKTYYLVLVNHDDLIKNDLTFFKQEHDLQNNFSGKSVKFKSANLLQITIEYDFSLETNINQSVTVRGPRCTKLTLESGNCGDCSFNIQRPSGQFAATQENSFADLGLSVKINERVYSLDELNASRVASGKLKIDLIVPRKVGQFYNLEIVQGASISYTKTFNGSGYENCHQNYSENSVVRSQVGVKVKLESMGRGEELRKIKL